MAITPLTLPGRAPSTLRPEDFATDMDARLAWEEINVAEMNALLPVIDAAVGAATSASSSAASASTSAAAAAAAAGALLWSSTTAYAPPAPGSSTPSLAVGNDGLTYRNVVAVTGGVDPALDTAGKWARLTNSTVTEKSITANYTVTRADLGCRLVCSGTFNLTFGSFASRGAGFWCLVQNAGTGVITVLTTGGEAVDGLASGYPMYRREERRFFTTPAGPLESKVETPYYLVVTSTMNRIQPPGYIAEDVDLVGGPGGAGSGGKGSTNSGYIVQGGSPGGTPARIKRRLAALTPGTSETITIGAAGVSGVGVSTNDTPGNNGANGGNTSVGSRAVAYGGIGGLGGGIGQPTSGAVYAAIGGSGALGRGAVLAWSSYSFQYAQGGNPSYAWSAGGYPNMPADAISPEGGAHAFGNGNGGNSIYGGAAAGSGTTYSIGGVLAGSSLYGVPAGGWGGSVYNLTTFVSAQQAGKTGGWNLAGAAPGTSGAAPTNGANGAPNAGTDEDMGNSGGGGGSTATLNATAGNGGNGSFPGGAPGGGGAYGANQAGSSGSGGVGAPGRAILKGVI